ncbi:nucleic acid/nucleotide deaminase domain-containing protein [Streptomyces sp. NPDC050743]|uniref:nucleic acid/nucleotide deaminase domain-containing protein n=1 Tax=Streptomyces sp. NPDC050743 TaxID=3365634 RepID=UPI003790D746
MTAVVDGNVTGDNARYIAAANQGNAHSERILDAHIDQQGISPEDVTVIYLERQPCSSLPNLCGARIGPYTSVRDDIQWSLNPDGPGYTGYNKAHIREAMDGYSPDPGVPDYEWVTK